MPARISRDRVRHARFLSQISDKVREMAGRLDSKASAIARREVSKKLARSHLDTILHAYAEDLQCIADELEGEGIEETNVDTYLDIVNHTDKQPAKNKLKSRRPPQQKTS